MAEVASVSASAASKKTKKTAPAAAKKPVAEKTRAHPPASEMVVAAITALNDKKGSSLAAIKKYIAGHFVCDVDRQATFIRKFIKSAVEKNTLVRTRGVGASGSFKLAKPEKTSAKKSKAGVENSAEKPEKTKKAAAKPKTTKATKKPNSPVKKTGKSPTKPKVPKAKAKKAASKPAKK